MDLVQAAYNNELIIFDFEVFKYNTLLGAYILKPNGMDLVQLWDLKEIKEFYNQHRNSIWIGHNNSGYDNFILQAIVNDFSQSRIKALNDDIIRGGVKPWLRIQLYSYDLMSRHVGQLKAIEAFMGKNISETEIDFNLQRELTEDEKRKVESYNIDDLNQTYDDFIFLKDEFTLRLEIINEFHLPMSCISVTGTRVAEEVLHAEKIPGIENMYKPPILWPTLKVKNQEIIDFYLGETWREGKTFNCILCGTEHKIASGGIHGCKKKCNYPWAFYFDVSGYYNLIMINLDLLPRSIPEEYRKYYKEMYQYQLTLKTIAPRKRPVYKEILLCVFGAMNNEYCRFYDPYNGDLVRMAGQMYLVDLLEKLEGKVEVIQSNTDGVIAYPINDHSEEEILGIIKEWENRTGFTLKLDKIYDIYQRDVNCYIYKDNKEKVHVLGEAVKHYGGQDDPFIKDSFRSTEPLIISKGIVEFFLEGKDPEQVVEENKNNLRLFQYIARKVSFDYMEYESITIKENELGKSIEIINTEKIQNVNRAFAWINHNSKGMIYKRKWDGKKTKVSNLPDSVFVYNNEILSEEAVKEVSERIDYEYYVTRIQERILEFIGEKV